MQIIVKIKETWICILNWLLWYKKEPTWQLSLINTIYIRKHLEAEMKNRGILVSIITPTYNVDKYIGETIASILSQTHSEFEVIIVDDCSTDNTTSIVKSFCDERIKLFSNEKNMGIAYSRNFAIKQATGDYIAFLDGDDLWSPTKLERQLDFMVFNGYSFSNTFYREIDESGNEIGFMITTPKKMGHKTFLRVNYVGCLTVMFKRDLFPGLEIPISILKRNDYALWLKLSEKAPCYVLKESLAFYRKRNSSISSGKKRLLIKQHKKMFSILYGFGTIKSTLYSFRNAAYYFFKRLIYKKKVK